MRRKGAMHTYILYYKTQITQGSLVKVRCVVRWRHAILLRWLVAFLWRYLCLALYWEKMRPVSSGRIHVGRSMQMWYVVTTMLGWGVELGWRLNWGLAVATRSVLLLRCATLHCRSPQGNIKGW